jgi:hypothetical protein
VRLWHRRQRRPAERLPDVPRHRVVTERRVSPEGARVTGLDPPGGGEANGGEPPQPPVSIAERAKKLEVVIAKRLQQGYWVESQGDTEAVVVSLGPRRWFGKVGPRRENTRETVTVDEQGHTLIVMLPKRRYRY